MATLQFKGKSATWNHHLSVPYHTLEKDAKKSLKGKNEADNLIIHGDNLLALKSLLPKYQGKVKCIYIDPPYNTGNEDWVYSDNVSSPTIKEWIGSAVGKDDLTRHDKWLCMMTPRLKLLRELLAEDGAIFVSIDKNEIAHLRDLMDEVFGEDNLVGEFVWRKKEGGGQTDDFFVTEHEYIIVYRKSENFQWLDEEIPADQMKFGKEDAQGKYNLVKLAKWGTAARREDRPKMFFSIKAPDGKNVYPKAPDGSEGRWRVGKERMDLLVDSDLVHWESKSGGWIAYEKVYFTEGTKKVIKERSIIFDLATTGDGTNELTQLFGKKDIFQNPKPSELIKFLIAHATDKNSIILDSFAGSGTTAHAVLSLNKEDEGTRSYILIEMEEYADRTTAERIRLASKKHDYSTGFTYHTLGPAIDADTMLSGNLPTYNELAKYVFYLATGKNHPDEKKISESQSLVGKTERESIYLIYEQNMDALKRLAVTLDWAQKIKSKDGSRKIVYAPACYLDEEMLDRFNIRFVSIPYNLFERT